MKISFVGDIMLGRFVGEKYAQNPYRIVTPSITEKLSKSDCVIANLESPVLEHDTPRANDHLRFFGQPQVLEQFKWVGCFSLSNNHINDGGTIGMDQTTAILDQYGLLWNGLYKKEYTPFIISGEEQRIAVITCDDLMNDEFAKDCPWKTLRVGDSLIDQTIARYKREGYFVIVYAHVGMLFTRFPSPSLRTILHDWVDAGAGMIVTVHSHVAGGMEYYKEVPIFHSLGDFVMDGNSFRRRKNYILNVQIEAGKLTDWDIMPTVISMDLQTEIPSIRQQRKQQKSFEFVSRKLAKHTTDYKTFFRNQYRKEMLAHSLSTIHFLYQTKGLRGLLRLLRLRMFDVVKVITGIVKDQSDQRYDVDAASPKHRLPNEKLK